jgi:predicted nucleic acid-binding protein
MILVDSSVWIDYFNGVERPETVKLDLLLGIESIAVGDIIVTEVLQGFKSDRDYQIAKDLFTSLEIFELVNTQLAFESADNYRYLRTKGITVRKTIDVIIATFCLNRNLPLLFVDRGFIPFIEHLDLISALEMS